MATKTIILLITLSIANVTLNIFASKVKVNAISEIFSSTFFGLAFTTGMVSLTTMIYLYQQEDANLKIGLLLAGAGSILVGTILASHLGKTPLTIIELALLASIAGFYLLRVLK